ncbi:phage regulatory CII family protein [Proteus hauseri]|uniref:phage regulatory CII family protein n=1 Tax=Proteus hauseri TaxID=183417 RepID=UPI0032DA84E2
MRPNITININISYLTIDVFNKCTGLSRLTIRDIISDGRLLLRAKLIDMKLTNAIEDASILNGVLEQMQCQPSVLANETCDSNVLAYLLTVVGEVGKLATNTVSGGNLNNACVAEFKRSVNTVIRYLTLVIINTGRKSAGLKQKYSSFIG